MLNVQHLNNCIMKLREFKVKVYMPEGTFFEVFFQIDWTDTILKATRIAQAICRAFGAKQGSSFEMNERQEWHLSCPYLLTE